MLLTDIIQDEERIFTGKAIPDTYRYDEYVGLTDAIYAVALPKTKEEVLELVKFANKEDLPIIARGAGTGLSGATSPVKGELIIDLHLMNRILDLDTETMTLTVEPGVLLQDIQEYVESRGYFYPPDPGSKHSSIGGNVATNAGGMRAVKYGVTRDYVRALEVILANGEELSLGSLNIKNSSGYDLKDLFIGSEGTLGITTQIKLKLIPLPKTSLSLVAAFPSLREATDAVLTILKNGVDPTALEFFERDVIELSEKENNLKFPSQKGQSYLLITLDGDDFESIQRRVTLLEASILPHNAVELISLTDPLLEETAWLLRDKLLTAVVNYTEQVTLDESVPINHISTLYQYTKDLEANSGLKMISFGHAGDGNLHTCVTRGDITDQTEWETKRDEVLDLLYAKIKELGGLPSAEHGIGIIKKRHFEKMFDPNYLNFMRQIKKVFDPDGRLNPSKVI
ncbi:FAD-binding oxidoreductase [Carnobacterium antarcticum]|uniref:FAD-binding oxidoreductase n=1 Tax=Carnobacterium antarcticum TaxID=2126436 RepID=A0ABW4NKJ0_9LACT|nr:FAD-binding oxidoreductase [Carnobacterium sp. CP1]ALV21771.1 Glycolate dehydrogenase, subunit GlcD [Carnobacterium sp. CP1]